MSIKNVAFFMYTLLGIMFIVCWIVNGFFIYSYVYDNELMARNTTHCSPDVKAYFVVFFVLCVAFTVAYRTSTDMYTFLGDWQLEYFLIFL